MRPIIFRGKRLDTREWISGSLLLINDTAYIYQHRTGDIEDIDFGFGFMEVDLDTVGEYTGLTEKSGEKIWEGDIVKRTANMRDYAECDGEVESLHIVQYFEYGLLPFCEVGYRMREYEVIGNIHDNPELLEENA